MTRHTVGETDVSSACDLLELPEVAELLRVVGRESLSAEQLDLWAEEQGLTPEAARRLLHAICGPLGDTIMTVQPDDFSYWCYPAMSLRRRLQFIDSTCMTDSRTQDWLRENPSMLIQLRIENAVASVRLDGIEIDFRSAKELLALNREPRNRPETVVANSFALFGQVERYARSPWSVDMLAEVFEQLLTDLDVSVPADWVDHPLAHHLPESMYPYTTTRAVLQSLAVLANGDSSDPAIHLGPDAHPVLVAVALERSVSIFQPFPMFNDLMGRFLWHCYVERRGYPVLGVTPFSTALFGLPPRPGDRTVHTAEDRASGAWRPEADLTSEFDTELQVLEQAVQDLRVRIKTRETREDQLRILLTVDPTLNPRQRSIIGRAICSPSATFMVPYHQTWHAIAYSTARADFQELEAKGYLARVRRGHAFVYTSVPDLAEKIGGDVAESLRAMGAAE